MRGAQESRCVTSRIKAGEQNGVALMRRVGKELRGEPNVQNVTTLFLLFFPLYLENISLSYLHPVSLPPPPPTLDNEWVSKSS